MDGLIVAKSTLSAYLHPSRTDDVQQGVHQLLNSLLLRYNEEFNGVVLAYSDIKICNWTAKILSGFSPYINLELKAKLLLFSPKPGMLLEGKVNKVEKDYIGVIVLGIFNAAVAFEDIPEEFCYKDNVDGIPLWAGTSSNHVITLGSTIKFVVKSHLKNSFSKKQLGLQNMESSPPRHIVQEESFLDISGSLEPPNTGCVNWLLSLSEKHSKFMKAERKIHKNDIKRGIRTEDTYSKVSDGHRAHKEFPTDHSYGRECKHLSKRKRNDTDTEVNDGTVSTEFPADNFHETKYSHKSKRKKNYTDSNL